MSTHTAANTPMLAIGNIGDIAVPTKDAAVVSEQSGHADKAKMIEQACAYVKQEAEAVKQAAFAAAYEKLHAKAD